MERAQKALQKRDYAQASEKLWGAAAQMVKALAQRRGWPHNGHRQRFEVVNRLVKETGDRELSRLFLVANALHTNFYERWLPADDVRRGAQDVERLLQKLEALWEQG